MIVCSCNILSKKDVEECLSKGIASICDVYQQHGCEPQCGQCARTVAAIIEEHQGPDHGFMAEAIKLEEDFNAA